MSILGVGGGAVGVSGFYPHTIDQSLRFDGSTSKFEITPSSDGNRKKWTTSWWVKRAKLGALQYMWSGASYYGNDGISALYFNSDDKLHMYFDANTHPYGAINNRVYRDTINWLHIVWAVDAENTATKVYVNGVEETSAIQPPNFSYGMNKASTKMGFGVATWGGSPNYNGYCAEFVHLDGQYLTADSFGQFENGIWVGKNIQEQGFTFGTNGFYLPFSDSSNIGYDYQTTDRSTTNDVTTTGLASSDVVPDSPTNNFCTLNTTDKSGGTLSEGNLRYDTSVWDMATGTFLLPSGKWYYEVRVDAYNSSNDAFSVGIIEASRQRLSGNSYYWSASGWNTSTQGYLYGVNVNGTTEYKISAGSAVSISSNPDIVQGSVIGIFIDLESATTSIKYNVDGGTPFELFTGMQDTDYTIGVSDYQAQLTFNFGQDSTFIGQETAGGNTDANGNGDFHTALPSGHTDYLALCSSNLSDTTLSPNKAEQADDYFNTVLYTGNGSSRSITDVGFRPDWSWFKSRSNSSDHYLYDSNRGANNSLSSNDTGVEDTTSGQFTQFTNTGFDLPADSAGYINYNSRTYASWNWRCGGSAPTKTYKVVVVSDSGNKYRFRNSADDTTFAQSAVALDLQEGGTYVFDWSDSSAQGHPFRFSTTSDGTHGGGSEYTTGVVKDDSAYTTTITVASSAPQLYYYCSIHSGMGGSANTNSTFGSTNFDGSILSVSQENQTAGFSIVTYTGNNGASGTIGHGLSSAPEVIILFGRNVSNSQMMGATSQGWTKYASFGNVNGYFVSDSTIWNNTAPTTTVFSVGSAGNVNDNYNYVAYCFHSVAGYSAIGKTYSGNSSSDGTYVHLGFRPAWILIKRASGTGSYCIFDNKMNPNNAVSLMLLADDQGNQNAGGTSDNLDFLSNGFKLRDNSSGRNGSGSTYIYMAFGDGNTAKFGNSK